MRFDGMTSPGLRGLRQDLPAGRAFGGRRRPPVRRIAPGLLRRVTRYSQARDENDVETRPIHGAAGNVSSGSL